MEFHAPWLVIDTEGSTSPSLLAFPSQHSSCMSYHPITSLWCHWDHSPAHKSTSLIAPVHSLCCMHSHRALVVSLMRQTSWLECLWVLHAALQVLLLTCDPFPGSGHLWLALASDWDEDWDGLGWGSPPSATLVYSPFHQLGNQKCSHTWTDDTVQTPTTPHKNCFIDCSLHVTINVWFQSLSQLLATSCHHSQMGTGQRDVSCWGILEWNQFGFLGIEVVSR